MDKKNLFLALLGVVGVIGLFASTITQNSPTSAKYDSQNSENISSKIEERLTGFASQVEEQESKLVPLSAQKVLGISQFKKVCVYGPYGITDKTLPDDLRQWKNIDEWNMENISKEAKWQMFVVEDKDIIPVSVTRKIVDMTDLKGKDKFPNSCFKNPVFHFDLPANKKTKTTLTIQEGA